MALVQSGHGKIKAFIDFTSEEVPVALTVQSPIVLGGGFRLVGEGNNADDGVVLQAALNGVGRLTTTDEDTEGMAVATAVCYDVAKMGPLVMEARVALPAQTARSVFVGFSGVAGAVQVEMVTGSTTTVTYASTQGDNVCGFFFDSQLTSKNWHIVHKGGTASAPTTTALCDSGVLPVNDEFDVLRVEIDPNANTRFYINGVLIRTTANTVSTTVNLAAIAGVWATTTTVATLDVDYVAAEANRYWDRTNA